MPSHDPRTPIYAKHYRQYTNPYSGHCPAIDAFPAPAYVAQLNTVSVAHVQAVADSTRAAYDQLRWLLR